MRDLSLHLLDILENSVAAGATRVAVTVAELPDENRLELHVEDDGRGLPVSPEQALDPFFTTKAGKRAGLGLALLRGAAEQAGGRLELAARPGGGVRVSVAMELDHVDRPPIGDLAATLSTIACVHPEVDLELALRVGRAARRLTLEDVASRLPGGRIELVALAGAVRREVTDALADVHGGRGDRPDTASAIAPPACGCGETATEAELLARLDTAIAEGRHRPGALIPVLQTAQAIFGYVPELAVRRIARGLGQSPSQVAGVVGFYSYFSTVPRGRHLIRVCLGTACYVRGGKAVLDAFRARLGIEVGGTSADRRFSLEVARCFGACGLAPAIMVDDDVHHRVKPARVGQLLSLYSDRDGHGRAGRQAPDVQAHR